MSPGASVSIRTMSTFCPFGSGTQADTANSLGAGAPSRVTRPANPELLRVIANEQPASVRETARLVDRDVRQVHDNLVEPETYELIGLEPDAAVKRPSVWYDAIAVDLPLFEGDAEYEGEALA